MINIHYYYYYYYNPLWTWELSTDHLNLISSASFFILNEFVIRGFHWSWRGCDASPFCTGPCWKLCTGQRACDLYVAKIVGRTHEYRSVKHVFAQAYAGNCEQDNVHVVCMWLKLLVEHMNTGLWNMFLHRPQSETTPRWRWQRNTSSWPRARGPATLTYLESRSTPSPGAHLLPLFSSFPSSSPSASPPIFFPKS